MPPGGIQDTVSLRNGDHRFGVSAMGSPILYANGPFEHSQILGGLDLWTEWKTSKGDLRLGATMLKDFRFYGSNEEELVLPGISVEINRPTESGKAAVQGGMALVWPYICDDRVETVNTINFIPAVSTWFGFSWSFGNPEDVRIIVGTKISPIFMFLLGGAVNAAVAIDIPFGPEVSLRPGFNAQFAIFAKYEDAGELDESYVWFIAGGGIGLVF